MSASLDRKMPIMWSNVENERSYDRVVPILNGRPMHRLALGFDIHFVDERCSLDDLTGINVHAVQSER